MHLPLNEISFGGYGTDNATNPARWRPRNNILLNARARASERASSRIKTAPKLLLLLILLRLTSCQFVYSSSTGESDVDTVCMNHAYAYIYIYIYIPSWSVISATIVMPMLATERTTVASIRPCPFRPTSTQQNENSCPETKVRQNENIH